MFNLTSQSAIQGRRVMPTCLLILTLLGLAGCSSLYSAVSG